MIRHFINIIILCIVPLCASAVNKQFTLVIDPGHGGNDAGAIGAISKEKNINLKVALAFGRLVEENCPDVKLVYTRKTDVFIPLHERANIANRNKANLFISIHTNALPKGRISRGVETYTLGMHRAGDNFDVAKRENAVILYEKDYKEKYEGFNPNSSESYIMFEFLQDKNMANSVELAKFVQKRTCASAQRQNKGVKQAGFLVLRETSMPSCLIELGFISTPDEERFLNSDQGVKSLAFGIFQAFCEYRAKYDKSVTVPFKATQYEEFAATRKDKDSDAKKAIKTEEAPKPVPVDDSRTRMMDGQQPDEEPQKPQTDYIAPVFKVQIVASDVQLKKSSPQLKGMADVQCYQENGMYKYTVGESENPNEILRLRKTLLNKFPQAFVIAFRDGAKMNVNEAIRDYKANRDRKK
ncbi:MAG: N-acetylmuramoyl-L-alanine amidase [Prevotella sp.]|nr:N-acetylmuramoyl-L-alanine amidase [Prevotella sp.]